MKISVETWSSIPLDLYKLLNAINAQNLHGEVDFGERIGHEVSFASLHSQ